MQTTEQLVAKLADYVGTRDLDAASDAHAAAAALVDDFCGTVPVPESVRGRAYLEVGAELFHRKNTKNGIAQFATPDQVSPIRIARDPMVAAYPLLKPYVGMGLS